jgi:hypothetical protein
MEEVSKLEVKRERGRAAAKAFRENQKSEISHLQSEIERLQDENREFRRYVKVVQVEQKDIQKDLTYASRFVETMVRLMMSNSPRNAAK